MGRACREMQAVALLALLVAPSAFAATTSTDDLPNLSTVTDSTATSGTSTTATSDTSTTAASDTTTSDASSTTGSTVSSTTDGTVTTSTSTGTATTTTTTTSSGSTTVSGVITDAPDIGVGIPTLVIPYTADAPFMQKSNLPEGTFFIAVGGVLALLGACVLLWRGLVAWSVNRSVRKAALASLRGGSHGKTNTWAPNGYSQVGGGGKGAMYGQYETGSNMSLDKLTSAGKNIRDHHHRHPDAGAPPPAGLFFSPTAHAQTGRSASPAFETPSRDRNSYLPAGYYASPSADRPAGGAGSTTIGGSLAPYARHSAISTNSPPRSPDLPPTSRSTATYYNSSSRDGARHGDGLSRDGYGPSVAPRNSGAVYAQPSTSSLMVGVGANSSNEQLGGSRAPSAYLEDLFENHGHGPRERF